MDYKINRWVYFPIMHLVLVLVHIPLASAQRVNATRTTIFTAPASATVQEGLQLVTIRDMFMLTPTLEAPQELVSPKDSPYAGQFQISGSKFTSVRVTYLLNEIIEEVGGNGGIIQVEYMLSGNEEDNQLQSLLFEPTGEFNIQLGEEGNYFLWVGANINVVNGTAGEYISEFTLELDYL